MLILRCRDAKPVIYLPITPRTELNAFIFGRRGGYIVRAVPPPVGPLALSAAVHDVDTPRAEEQWPICSARAADRLHHHERHFQRSATDDRSESLSRADDCGIYDETLARLLDAQKHLQSGPEIAEGGLLPEGESQTAARRPPDADVHCAQAPLLRNASTLYKRAETAVARSHHVVNSIPNIPMLFSSAHNGG